MVTMQEFQSNQWRKVLHNELADLAQKFIDNALMRYRDDQSEETFVECVLCGEVDSHKSNCPIPALETFLSQEEI